MPKRKLSVSAADYLPEKKDLSSLRKASQGCKGCDLYKGATQAVFGEGPARAEVLIVGTMPGDQEDKQGRPFVGPAGRLLDKALEEAGIDRSLVYITNAVKHFKFVRKGSYRLHRNPGGLEMRACRPWLDSEVQAIKPKVIVGLGTLAGESLLDRKITLKEYRGRELESIYGIPAYLTTHPSALLRMRGAGGDYEAEYKRFVSELSSAWSTVQKAEMRQAA